MKRYGMECRRNRQKNHRPRYKVGDWVRLRNGDTVRVMRIVVQDWTTEYDLSNGAVVAQHHIMERVS